MIQHFSIAGSDAENQGGKGLLGLVLVVNSNAVSKELSLLTWNNHRYHGGSGAF